jgi:coenzyme F420-reducing hydrogenase delta subunit
MANENKTVVTLICERAADVNDLIDADGKVTSVDGLHVVKLPCSGMIQPLMIEAAMKAGAAGVIVCGCQIGDCYYREGNKMIRDRLLGERPPTLKKATDRRRILALWLSRVQKERFLSEAKTFVQYVHGLEAPAAAASPAVPAKSAAPAAATKTTPAAAEAKGTAQAAKTTPEATKPEGVTKDAKAPEEPAKAVDAAPKKEDDAAAAKEEKAQTAAKEETKTETEKTGSDI